MGTALTETGAGNEARTRYLHLGKVALYQMSYARATRHSIADLAAPVKTFFRVGLKSPAKHAILSLLCQKSRERAGKGAGTCTNRVRQTKTR